MTKEKNAIVIAGFPGVGKTYLSRIREDLVILDSDSSSYSWLSPGVRNPDFPDNYIDHIEESLDKADVILTSTHEVVREALDYYEIDFYLVYPNIDLLHEYIRRYIRRGSDESFVKLMQEKWDVFINECKYFESDCCTKIELKEGQHLKDILDTLLK